MRVPKIVSFLFLFFFTLFGFSQDFSDEWKGHFSFNNIIDVSQSTDQLYAASNNAVFTYDLTTFELEQISSINGLSGETISNIHYSEAFQLLVIGYETGLIEIVSETDSDVLSVVDILDKETIPPTNKRINHFNEFNGLIYISTDYGISVYDLQNLEFGDTYFIGPNGSQKKITQTAVFGDFIYSASSSGVQKAEIANSNLIDFQQWETILPQNFVFIESVNDKLYVSSASGRLYEIIDDGITLLILFPDRPVDIRSWDNRLLVTTDNNFYVYDENFMLVSEYERIEDLDSDFTCGTINDASFFVGTKDFGILKVEEGEETQTIFPNGPLQNDIFAIENIGDNLWATFGGYNISYGFGSDSFTGVSHYKDEEWVNISYDSINENTDGGPPRFMSHPTPNPLNPDQVFVSSYFSGLVEIEDDQAVGIYNQDNSTIIPFAGNLHLTLDGAYDQNNALWVFNARVNDALNKFENGQWTAYSFASLIENPGGNFGYSAMDFDSQGTIFIGSERFGLIGFNPNGGNQLLKNIKEGEGEGNLPGNTVNTVAIDNRNQLWIGTNKGLRVLFNTSNFFETEEVNSSQIIILEDGVPKELLFQQFITDIEVDGSNNKWVATIGAGLFYFSSDGQETIFHFTKDDSPLPSNNVTDVAVDQENGRVYIGTDNGLVSFASGGSKPNDGLADAFIYPNPVRPTFNIDDEKVKIKDISDNVNIKITDIEGNLVAEAQSQKNARYKGFNLEIDGGTAFWNGRNLANNIVSSGVYLVMLSDLDTFETKVLKVMVVR